MKRRILVTIVGQGSIAHIIRSGLLQNMAKFCTPVIAILWQQNDLIEELVSLGYEVHIFPDYKTSVEYKAVRGKLDYWFKKYIVQSPSTKIEEDFRKIYFTKRKIRLLQIKNIKLSFLFSFGNIYKSYLVNQELILIQKDGNYDRYAEWLDKLNLDGLFTVTPFLQEVDLIIRIFKKAHKKLLASIHSFDNVTKRGWVSTFCESYIVWNKYNKDELLRIHPPLVNHIFITGAPQFDFHYDESNLWDYLKWKNILNIPDKKRVILYGSGNWWILPTEYQYIEHLNNAIDNGDLPSDVIILLRCHPLDKPERWNDVLKKCKNVIIDSYKGIKSDPDKDNFTLFDIQKLVSTLSYSDVHINFCSTMAVDGSVFNKPQIGPAYDEFNVGKEKKIRAVYSQEHYVPIIEVQGVSLANSKQELIALVNKALAQPAVFTANCAATVETITTYRDGQSTNRVLQIIRQFFGA